MTNSKLDVQVALQSAQLLQQKFGEWSCLAPWLPEPWLQWHGTILLRTIYAQLSTLLDSRVKPIENVNAEHWIS